MIAKVTKSLGPLKNGFTVGEGEVCEAGGIYPAYTYIHMHCRKLHAVQAARSIIRSAVIKCT